MRATVAICGAWLSTKFKSTSSLVTFGTLVIRPIDPGESVMEADADEFTARSANRQVTIPPACEQLPELAAALTNVTPLGSGSVRATLVALLGPLFETSRV